MMRWIVGSSLRFRYIVVVAGAALMVFGVRRLRDTPVDVFPEFAQPRVEIQTPSLGLSAAEVEQLVTVPLEQSLQGLPDLETIRSKSVPQLSSIQLLFERGTDLLHARQLVQERVEAVTPTLPTWSSPAVHDPAALVDEPGHEDRAHLGSPVPDRDVDDRLLEDQGPAVAGTRRRERADLGRAPAADAACRSTRGSCERTASRSISVMDSTADALDAGLLQFSDGALIGTGGFVDTPNQRLNIRHVLPIVTPG